MSSTDTNQAHGRAATQSGAASQFGAAHGYPSLGEITTGAETGMEREGSGRSLLEKRAREKAWRAANPEKCLAYARASYARNKTRRAEHGRKWRKNNLAKKNAINRRWRERNPEAYRAAQQREVDNLSAAYVAKKMRLRVRECPPELIELKRAHIQLQRELRKTK